MTATEEKRRRVTELRAEGLTLAVVAQRLGMHPNTVHKYSTSTPRPRVRRVSAEVCTIEGCGRQVDASGLCSTHRRRRRLKLDMGKPIRPIRKEVTLTDLLDAAFDLYETEGEAEYTRKRRAFAALVRRWAACP